MKDPLVEGDKKVEKSTPQPADRSKRADDLAIELAEEWNESADGAGESTGS
jgi:hypothetical protein